MSSFFNSRRSSNDPKITPKSGLFALIILIGRALALSLTTLAKVQRIVSPEPSPLIQQETETESLDEARLAAGTKAEAPGYLGDASGQQSRTPDQAHSPNAPTETDAQAPVSVPASPAEVQGYPPGILRA